LKYKKDGIVYIFSMTNPNFFNIILVWPIINILVVIYQGLVALHVPSPLGFAIVLLTVVIRFLLYPLTASQLRASKKMQTISPHLSRLKEKHKNDAKTLQQETMKLYKEHGINPAAGCLPVLIQLPVIWALYSVLQQVVGKGSSTIVGAINKILYIKSMSLHGLWDQHFFGLPLGATPAHIFPTMPFIILFPVATALFQFIQSKMMFAKSSVQKEDEKKQEKKDDFSSALQTQSLYVFPLMIGFFSYTFPLGLSLYWNTFTIFGIIQQYRIQGLGGLEEWITKLKKHE